MKLVKSAKKVGVGMIVLVYIILGLLAIFLVKTLLISVLFKVEIDACFQRDPAAVSYMSILLTYPGLQAIVLHRISHRLLLWRVPFLPQLVSRIARQATGIEIHPAAKIGRGLFIDHGMGVVIGETAEIGENVTLFQGVTLGGTGKKREKRHPTLGNNVVVGAGAKVLGNIIISDNVNIGANAVIIKSVPQNSTVVGIPGRITSLPDPLTERLEKLQRHIDEVEKELARWKEGEK
ncbi:MAG: Serine acetyltransferase [Syntrophomonadaceae bacterium]|nr:Serine acetyltransferase [Bacillota bacterium]MBT9138012.1 Serine acetyltransferase [Bacillota bacterium]MBT9146599.1 Serine acetyltransferase [Bacillota bacterium]